MNFRRSRPIVCGVLAVAIGLTACGTRQTSNPAVSQSRPAASRSASPSASPTAQVPRELLYAVLESHTKTAAGYSVFDTVAIAGLDGYARAKATFTPLTPPYVGCLGPLFPPQGYTAAGRVFYIDGKGVVRSLAVDRTIVQVARFPIGQQQEASFAVSPDGSHLVGTVLTIPPKSTTSDPCASGGTGFAAGDWAEDVYAAETGGPSRLISHRTWTQSQPNNVLAFVGWDSHGPIATEPTSIGTQGGGPIREGWYGPVGQVDAGTGSVIRQLGDANCYASDVGMDGTYVCAGLQVFAPDGTPAWRPKTQQDYYIPLLSSDTHLIAAQGAVLSRDRNPVQLGPSVVDGSFFSTGWLDNQTVIGWFGQDLWHLGYVRLSNASKIEDLGFSGTFVGVVQSD